MKYIKIHWLHNFKDDPEFIYSAINEEGYEEKKIEIFKRGNYIVYSENINSDRLAEGIYPSLKELTFEEETETMQAFEISEIKFKEIWDRYNSKYMENEIINKTYNKPRDMFDDACLLIAKQLEDSGFKYSKSQATIKKKDKLLAYTISFFSSYRNYIYEDGGHVVMEFYCNIENKGKTIFYLNQKELRSEMYRFELFDNEIKKLDLKQIENINEFIRTHFLPVVFAIQNDVNTFLENTANEPIARFDDYGFQYEKDIFEIFNRQDLIEKYDNKIKEFNNKKAENNGLRFKKYLLQNFDKSKLEELNICELKETLYMFWSSANMENKMVKIYYEYEKKLFENLSKNEISDKIDWLIEYYSLLTSFTDYIEDEKLKEQAIEYFGQFKKCFKND